jgi:hypothetical protein
MLLSTVAGLDIIVAGHGKPLDILRIHKRRGTANLAEEAMLRATHNNHEHNLVLGHALLASL